MKFCKEFSNRSVHARNVSELLVDLAFLLVTISLTHLLTHCQTNVTLTSSGSFSIRARQSDVSVGWLVGWSVIISSRAVFLSHPFMTVAELQRVSQNKMVRGRGRGIYCAF